MAKQRIVNTKFWDDSYIASLVPIEKLVFLYLLTSPLTNISGVYELPLKRAAFDVGMEEKMIERIFAKLERDKKIVREGNWVGIVNFIKHQSTNPSIRRGIAAELQAAPKQVLDTLSTHWDRLGTGSDSRVHLNLNSIKSNSNPNGIPDNLFEDQKREIQGKVRGIGDKWKLKP